MTQQRDTQSPVDSPGCLPGTGTEWLIDVQDCDPARLRCLDTLRELCEQLITDLELNVVGQSQWHQFPGPAGVTGLYLLSESHLACHTFPEFGFATFNLYCCRQREPWDWESQLTRRLGAGRVSIRQLERGAELPADTSTHLLSGSIS